jgi:Ca-activated chloride channel homolog
VDEETLKKIADTTGGKYYRATDTKTLNQIFEQIDALEKSTVELNQFTQFRELFPWPLGVGLGVLALHALLGQTVGRKLP